MVNTLRGADALQDTYDEDIAVIVFYQAQSETYKVALRLASQALNNRTLQDVRIKKVDGKAHAGDNGLGADHLFVLLMKVKTPVYSAHGGQTMDGTPCLDLQIILEFSIRNEPPRWLAWLALMITRFDVGRVETLLELQLGHAEVVDLATVDIIDLTRNEVEVVDHTGNL
ncbi:MAG: hypothetical protein M1826_001071 [Phylliscum demangeonii]|nr:MAG: hypothetical protein M1826_001071 [Phylliscum demangeonii]